MPHMTPLKCILASLATLLIAISVTGCRYLDQDITLSDEEFLASVEDGETIDLDAMYFGSGRGGCGAGGWGSHMMGRRGMGAISVSEPSIRGEDEALRESVARIEGLAGEDVGRFEQEEVEEEGDVVGATNHDVIEQVAALKSGAAW